MLGSNQPQVHINGLQYTDDELSNKQLTLHTRNEVWTLFQVDKQFYYEKTTLSK